MPVVSWQTNEARHSAGNSLASSVSNYRTGFIEPGIIEPGIIEPGSRGRFSEPGAGSKHQPNPAVDLPPSEICPCAASPGHDIGSMGFGESDAVYGE